MQSSKKKVLFVCVHNSARSQMAEAFLQQLAGDRFKAVSAGIEPGKINPLVVDVLQEVGIDISQHGVNSVFDLFKQGRLFQYVITVCDESSGERCPIFPGIITRLHWSFDDPSRFEGCHEEKLAMTRVVRDQIREKIKEFIATV